MYGENIKVTPRHEDVFGVSAKTENQVISELKKFDSRTIFHMCTKLVLFLNRDQAQSPKEQTKLALGLLNQEARDRLQSFAEKQEEDGSDIIIFHHFPVVMMTKLNLEHNKHGGFEITDEATRTRFASLLLSLSDIWLNTERAVKGNLRDKRRRKSFLEGFRAFQARQFLQENSSEPMPNLLARGAYLIEKARDDKRLDFAAIFESATGMKLELYLDMLLMIMTQWTVNVEISELDKLSVRSEEEFFKNTTLKAADIELFLDTVGFKIKDYNSLNEALLEQVGLRGDDNPENFITFMNKPILRYENKFMCVNPNFLLLQLTEGPYNIVRDALKGTGKEQVLPVVWGDTYEQYVIERLKSAFGESVYANILDTDGNEVIDALVYLGDKVLVVEIKYPHWSFKARTTGKRSDMRPFMEKIARYNPKKEKPGEPKVDKKKGLGQIKRLIERVNEGTISPPISFEGKQLVPVLVLGEEFPADPINRDMLNGHVSGEGCLMLGDKRVLPYIVLVSEEVELIESLSEKLGIEATKELLINYVMRFHPSRREEYYIKRPTSFKNEIFNSSISVPNSKYIQRQIDIYGKRPTRYFQKPSKK